MSRIEREKQTVRKMIELYCRHRLNQDTIPEEHQHLAEFACRRIDHCKYGENKTACKKCPTQPSFFSSVRVKALAESVLTRSSSIMATRPIMGHENIRFVS